MKKWLWRQRVVRMAEPQTGRPNGEKVNWKMWKGAILSLSTAVSPGAMSSCLLTRIAADDFFFISPLQNLHISGAKSFEPTHWCNQEDVEQQPKDKIRWDDMSKINWISQWQSTLIVLRSCASPCSSPYHLSALLFHFFLLIPLFHKCVGLFLTLMKTDRSHSFCFCQVVPRCEPFL